MTSHGKTAATEGTLRTIFSLFLGKAPDWYKLTIIAFLVLNPVVLFLAGPFVAGWIILLQFIFTLALALKCYPLQPGGLLAIEAVIIGLTSAGSVYHETEVNFPILLLLMFMVAGIYFLRDLLIFIFSKLFLKVRGKPALSLLFCAASALMSAFLDALTVMAVIITVATGLFGVYHKLASEADGEDEALHDSRRQDFAQFRGFLRSIVMHSAIGTALGGVATMVGEPQNLLIAKFANWDFGMFIVHVAPVSLPVLIAGLLTCYALERLRLFGYGEKLPASVRDAIARHDQDMAQAHDRKTTVRLWAQAIAALLLVAGLAFHVAEVGLIGLSIIVLATAFCGVIEEKRLGHAFEEALPFTGLLVTFFAIVAVIHEQDLFKPVIDFVLAHEGRGQLALMYIANGMLSAISDNVFVATVYISSVKEAFDAGAIDKTQFDLLAVAINVGTNIPSVATPNGQAAFLFLLTSALAPLIRLGYGKMLWMAVPYTLTLSLTGLAAVYFFL